jgi:hypothetical protein
MRCEGIDNVKIGACCTVRHRTARITVRQHLPRSANGWRHPRSGASAAHQACRASVKTFTSCMLSPLLCGAALKTHKEKPAPLRSMVSWRGGCRMAARAAA